MRDGEEAPRVELVRRFSVPREVLYACFTELEHLVRWFGPGDVRVRDAELEVRVGGKYRIEFLSPDGGIDVVEGEYLEVTPPERLRFTWVWQIWRAGPVAEETLVTVQLLERGDGTEVRIVHERFGDRHGRDLHAEGWALTLDCLDALLESGIDKPAGGRR
jgi:uncharacterized protein YndB with AHSA1/START domain